MANKEKGRILIVDDNDEIRSTYSELLKKGGFDIVEAKDGVEGLDYATSKGEIDLIFTGIIMPRMDGFQLIEALKKNTTTANIPVVVNSHLGREEDRKAMFDLGARDFIVQGVITPSEVVRRIVSALGKGEYMLNVDPKALDAQQFIFDYKYPADFKCDNCGADLAVGVSFDKEKSFSAGVKCSGCKKIF